MRRHPRSNALAKASSEATMWILDWQRENGLTDAEVLSWHAERLGGMAKYAIRDERATSTMAEEGSSQEILDSSGGVDERICGTCCRWGPILAIGSPLGFIQIQSKRGQCTKFNRITADGDTCKSWEAT